MRWDRKRQTTGEVKRARVLFGTQSTPNFECPGPLETVSKAPFWEARTGGTGKQLNIEPEEVVTVFALLPFTLCRRHPLFYTVSLPRKPSGLWDYGASVPPCGVAGPRPQCWLLPPWRHALAEGRLRR